ncbi:Cyclic di-GMP binding protein precursor [plant metagenome]|uniref:Cyclic di-GMP-binding protein n=1 Tax=plant metagenome TaxID=1297885 RepID=A0A484PUL5_9ZZZZ
MNQGSGKKVQEQSTRRLLPSLLSSLLALGLHAGVAHAAPAPTEPTAETAPADPAHDPAAATAEAPAPLPAGAYQYEISLRELGARFPIRLAGVDSSNTVRFSTRADEELLGARLKMDYAYSPSLITELSHLKVLVNDEVTSTLALPKEEAGSQVSKEVDLPPKLVRDYNRLNLQLIAHYTMECEDPLHSSLWANVSNDTKLALTVAPIEMPNDLAILPRPFFDARDVRRLKLPFVFAATPDNATLEAAGTLSSWFGALAGFRGAQFSAQVNAIPAQGSAIVLLTGGQRLAGVDAGDITGPTLQMVANPNDPYGKLLLVRGRNAEELKTAAAAVSLGTQTLTGERATITKLEPRAPRRPYDAPNWLRSDRPVRFGELVSTQDLNVAGYRPDVVNVDLRLPPDLFAWRDKHIPINLKYRYTPRPAADQSTLNVQVEGQFLRSLPLLPETTGAYRRLHAPLSEAEALIMMPVSLAGAHSTLQFLYFYDYVKQGECRDVIIDNVRGAIEPDSTIDISGFSHYLAMPDLSAYARSGFPFTRLADLAETAVVMPDGAGELDLAAYLTLMGRLGESTGYPGTAVTVTQAANVQAVADKDLLVIDSGKQPLTREWRERMPANLAGENHGFSISDLMARTFGWLSPDPREREVKTRAEIAQQTRGASNLLTGFESPLKRGRSVVVVSASNPGGLETVTTALMQDRYSGSRISGSVSVVRDDQVTSLTGEHTYYVGRLTIVESLYWFFSRHPVLLLLLGLVSVVLLAVVVYFALRARAKQRLQA